MLALWQIKIMSGTVGLHISPGLTILILIFGATGASILSRWAGSGCASAISQSVAAHIHLCIFPETIWGTVITCLHVQDICRCKWNHTHRRYNCTFKNSIWLMSRTGSPLFACAVICASIYILFTYTSP